MKAALENYLQITSFYFCVLPSKPKFITPFGTLNKTHPWFSRVTFFGCLCYFSLLSDFFHNSPCLSPFSSVSPNSVFSPIILKFNSLYNFFFIYFFLKSNKKNISTFQNSRKLFYTLTYMTAFI